MIVAGHYHLQSCNKSSKLLKKNYSWLVKAVREGFKGLGFVQPWYTAFVETV
jgi:hypothetical protein